MVKLSEDQKSKDAIIIIHGDHGPGADSLNVKDVPFDPNSKEYGQAAYSTFFTVRTAGLAPEYDSNRYMLSVLLEDVFTSNVINRDAR